MYYRHGHAVNGTSPTYKSWEQMHQRCKNHPEYAGRGITVTPRWSDFKNFLEDMGEKPVKMTLDRIDNDGGYNKDNCRWATYSQQNYNQRQRRPRKSRHGNAILTDAEVLAIHSDPRSGAQIGADYGIDRGYANRIKRGEAHKHLFTR